MRRALIALIIVGTLLPGCGGKGGGGGDGVVNPPPPPTGSFRCSSESPEPDEVVLQCGAAFPPSNPQIWQIDANIGPPSTATDIQGFAFDIVFDPAHLEYVDGSARAGELFFQTGMAPLVSVQTNPSDPGRLIIGIAATGTDSGVQATASYHRIVILSFKVVPGAMFDPDVVRFENYQALDPNGNPISSIRFMDVLLLSNQ